MDLLRSSAELLAGAGLLVLLFSGLAWVLWRRAASADPGLQDRLIPIAVLEQLLRDLPASQLAALLKADGKVISAGPAALQALGLPPGAVMGRHFGDLPCWNEPPASRHALNRLLLQASTGKAGSAELAQDGPRGRRKLQLRLSPVEGLPYLVCTAQEAQAPAQAAPATAPVPDSALVEELASLLPAARDLDETCRISVSFLSRLFPRCSGALYLSSDPAQGLVPKAQWGQARKLSPRLDSPDCWALRRGGEHWVEPGAGALCCDHALGGEGLCHVCLPLLSRGETIGLLYLEWVETSDAPSRKLPRLLGETLAPALGHARASQVLRELATRDALTGLLNRRSLEENLPKLMQRASDAGRPLSVLLFDVDHFKRFNDQFGHDAGDLVLRNVGQKLMSSLREGDLAFRYGGEEMLVVLPGNTAAEAALCAERMRAAIHSLALVNRGERLPPITASAGIAQYPLDGAAMEDLVKWADRGLYAAKAAGRDRAVHHSEVPVRAAA